MKLAALVLTLFLISGCAHSPATPASVDIPGFWKGEINNPAGGPPTRLAFNFTRDGGNLFGVMRNETLQGGWEKLEDFKVKGNRIYFTFSPKISQSRVAFKYSGKIEGDIIKMAYKLKDAVKPVGGDGGFDASKKVGRDGMNDIGKNIARSEVIGEFTLTRVQ